MSTAPVRREVFGLLPGGVPVEAVVLTRGGTTATVLTLGAILQSLSVPDRDGRMADIVLGFPTLAPYLLGNEYFGAIIGRFANRIADGRFSLDGREYALARNDGANALHGGIYGFDKCLWTITAIDPAQGVMLRLVSPDGDEGYPGELTVDVRYALDAAGALSIEYRAVTDRATVVNLTNHSYFNLAGEGSSPSALEARLTIIADHYLPVDPALIPTGERRNVTGTPFDFRAPTPITDRVRDADDPQIAVAHGYDHNYVLRGGVTPVPRLAARLDDPASGRSLELLTTEPGLQLYSGNFLDGTAVGKRGTAYRRGDGVALEVQHFPDSPNQPAFPATRLDPGEFYRQTTIYRFGVLADRPNTATQAV